MIVRMDTEIANLNDRQAVEMENKIEQLDVSTTSEVKGKIIPLSILLITNRFYPQDINNLLSQQYSTQNLIRQRWESELEARKGHQKNEYKNWIIGQVGETLCSSSTTATAVGNRSSMFVSMQTPSMEESFTIHLGSQLKHMHNIRILSADISDVCSPLHSDDERWVRRDTRNMKFEPRICLRFSVLRDWIWLLVFIRRRCVGRLFWRHLGASKQTQKSSKISKCPQSFISMR